MSMEKAAPVTSQDQGLQYPLAGREAVNSNILIVHHAIERIGMGKYQWQLLTTCGFGFLIDQMLFVSISILAPTTAKEFGPAHSTLLSAPLYVGLLMGAIAYGALADKVGRRLIWQISIYGVSIVNIFSASATSWTAMNVWMALSGLFGGGNLAIDLAVLSEALPQKWMFLLTGLACVWGLGSAITGLIAWPLVVAFCCPNGATPETCSRSENMGWRYLQIILGGLCLVMSLIRSFVIGMKESPKWLVTKGRIEEAMAAINSISKKNGSDYVMDIDQFSAIPAQSTQKTHWRQDLATLRSFIVSAEKLRLLICLIVDSCCYPTYTLFLSYYLEAHGADLGDGSNYQTYRDWAVSAVVGILGPALSAWMGRPYPVSGVSMVPDDHRGIIYAYTPIVFSTEHRGTACGLLLSCGRAASLSAPFIATYGKVDSPVPLFVSCGLYVAIGVAGLLLPLEPSAADFSINDEL
ncbi:hypothetical protein EYB26_000288 [Talaromyces marneffei]|uniref:uncharacterized protein n=1 Tax=Talaromyces marneffei TaxID=37727 RepID=UPI0012A92B28|nr:uncharacterized protein EYB26_000288 [Talaromyces marneffei]QGA12644.1 hypothetical protein EYB26_000288 [Talaromyces marneffei]